ncbi:MULTISPECIES: regulatory protein RecX [Thermodesulfovibrio]|jgi:regulatory protein|uniref:regulatory protein RecX n=1 Tax=Thermodesulfovibrio TaxID=28261 RepID=UPI002604A452|nr:regulatory protein RecX [Thermodesulfovibrio sp.]
MEVKKRENEILKTALKLLSLKDRTEAELREKLKSKGYIEREINGALEYLKQKGLLDDSKFIEKADRIAEDRFLGKMGIKHYLMKRGIEKDKLESLPPINEILIARKLIQRKRHLLRDLPGDKKKAKIAGFLLRRGFSWETVNECVNKNFD